MAKTCKIILVVSIITNLILGFILLSTKKSIKPNFDSYVKTIDSLELELTTLKQTRDSIRSSIDTVYVEINNNKSSYEEIRNIILSNSVNDDYLFFTEYLSKRKQ